MKIMIIGAGGVGGFLAGSLLKKYDDITIVARGAHKEAIARNGLTLLSGDGDEYTARPALCTDKPEKAGIQDAIIFCTKSYDLEQAVKSAASCIGEDTVLLPILNGVSAARVIREQVTLGEILHGCIYLFGLIEGPGRVRQVGTVKRLVMGGESGTVSEKARTLCSMLNECGVEAEVSTDIQKMMWMKWLLMTSNAQGASYFNVTIGEVRSDKERFDFVLSMLDEALAVAHAEKIPLDNDVREQIIKTIWTLAPESQPSLSRDLNTPGKSTELDLFAGELKRLAEKHQLPTPATDRMLRKFQDRL